MSCCICEKDPEEHCYICENDFCYVCMEDHEHCMDCLGTGSTIYEIRRDSEGNEDYLNGGATGVYREHYCARCNGTGIE